MKKRLKHADTELQSAIIELENAMGDMSETAQSMTQIAIQSIKIAQKYIDSDLQLEEIRDLNSDLRAWGHHCQDEANYWEREYNSIPSPPC